MDEIDSTLSHCSLSYVVASSWWKRGPCDVNGRGPCASSLMRNTVLLSSTRVLLPHNSSTLHRHDPGNSAGTITIPGALSSEANTSQRLARWLDRPLFPWKRLVVGFSLAEFALENWLLFRQYRVLQRTSVPKALDKEIERDTFDKSQVGAS